jgi:hypothetical protein
MRKRIPDRLSKVASMEITSIPVEFLFSAHISGLGRVFRIPNTPRGNRLLVPAITGTFKGPRMRGVYLPGLCRLRDANWATRRSCPK